MKFHDELNQKLFNDTELKKEVYDKLLEISEAFIEYLDINDEAIKDIVITGSSASYNYTEYSDLDLHLIVDYEKVHEECPIVEGYLWSMKSAFNKDHDISIYGVPVEVYAEDSNQQAVSNGVYSLLNDEWIKFPEKIEPTDNDSAVLAKYKELKEASERIEDSEVAEELLDKIYAMRKAGLAEVGEFSTENLAFKMLRNDGVIEKLKQMKKEKIDKQLTLESVKQGYICLHISKNKNNYGFVQVRNNELYYDYNSNDCTQFKSLEEAKPIINRLVKAGFTVTLIGTGNFSYLNDHRKYTFESYNKKDIKMENKQNAKSLLNKMNEMQLGEHEYIAPFFYGFYESMYTNDGNIEWDLFNDPNSVPEEILNKCIQEAYIPDEYYKDVCSAYLDVLDSYLKDTIKSWGTSELVEIDSPKEYNFRTDDIVAKINITDEINNEINEYIQNNKEAFKKWIKDHHSSYDGFISFYSNDAEEWLELEDLDHNELGSILGFILENQEGDEIEWRLNETTWESTGGTHWTVDLEDVVQDFNFNVEPESLEDLENFVYDKENDIYVWNKENPDQLKLKYESRKIKSLLKKMNETLDYKEMNKKVDEYRKQNNLSPTFEINTFDKDSEEWKKLREVGIKVSENSPIKLRVENIYFDYGQKWMWTTLIATEERADNTSTWQAINPSQQAAILAGYGDEVAQDLIDKYNKEYNKNESTNVKSLLNKINEISDEVVNTVAMKRFTNDSKAFDKLNKEIADDKNPKAGKLYPSEKEYAKAHKKLMNNSRLLRNRNIIKYGESLVEKCNKQLKKVNESSYGMPDEIEEQVKTAIDNYISKHGQSFEIYVDYRDELDKSTIQKIFESDRPLDAFYEIIGDWDWWENADYGYDYILKEKLELSEEIKEEYATEISDMLRDYVSYEIPYSHFNTTVGFDVFLNNPEDANTEYSAEMIEYNEDGSVYGVNGEINKLLQLQGHTEEEFVIYINDKQSGNKFFDSLLNEIENATYGGGNQVVFLVQAPITEMAQAIQERKTITIPSDAMCGLFEAGNGSGSVLEIKLEKDITGAITDMTKPSYQARDGVFEVFYKDGYRYNVDEVYGMVSSAWDSDVRFN